jgi:hypothetical protein
MSEVIGNIDMESTSCLIASSFSVSDSEQLLAAV